jgi:hypothetical protein
VDDPRRVRVMTDPAVDRRLLGVDGAVAATGEQSEEDEARHEACS